MVYCYECTEFEKKGLNYGYCKYHDKEITEEMFSKSADKHCEEARHDDEVSRCLDVYA